MAQTLSRTAAPAALALILTLAMGGCAAPASTGSGSTQNLLVEETIRSVSASDAYELVERLRPRWIQARGITSIQNPGGSYPQVYVDGTRFGPLASLREVSTNIIVEMSYMSPGAATNRFGTGHAGGVIMVSTRR